MIPFEYEVFSLLNFKPCLLNINEMVEDKNERMLSFYRKRLHVFLKMRCSFKKTWADKQLLKRYNEVRGQDEKPVP